MSAAEPPLSTLSRAFGKTLMTTMGMTIVGFISSVITTRMLGPEGRGLMSAALMIAMLAASVAQCGMSSSYVYHFGAARAFAYLRLLAWSLAGVSALACLLAWGGLQISNDADLHRLWWLVLLFTALTASQLYLFSLTQLHANLHFFNALRFAQVFGNLLMLAPLLLWFRPVTAELMMLSQVAVLASLTAAGLWWARKHRVWALPEAGERVSTAELMRYGLHQHGVGLLGIFLLNFDKLFLLHRSSIKEYGYYALAFGTSRLIGSVQEAVSTALFARFAGRDVHQLSATVRDAFRVTFVPMLLLAALGAAVAPWLLVLVYGKAFAAMTVPFNILLFECVIGGASWTLAQRFNAGGQPGLVLVRQFVSILPVLVAVPFLPAENTYVYLALLMLCGACLRLIMTIVLSTMKLKEPMPRFLPLPQDVRMALRMLKMR
jgi:O-antigen/teichoic acid export membrane protein